MDSDTWNTTVWDPYAEGRSEGVEMLEELLKRVMIRVDKSVLASSCHVTNTFIDFNEGDASSYNWLVSLARRNLITSHWYCEPYHKESLLHSSNWKAAQRIVSNLQYACTISGSQNAQFAEPDVTVTLDTLYEKFSEKLNIGKNDRFDDPWRNGRCRRLKGSLTKML